MPTSVSYKRWKCIVSKESKNIWKQVVNYKSALKVTRWLFFDLHAYKSNLRGVNTILKISAQNDKLGQLSHFLPDFVPDKMQRKMESCFKLATDYNAWPVRYTKLMYDGTNLQEYALFGHHRHLKQLVDLYLLHYLWKILRNIWLYECKRRG